jgi:hypothetical protein
MQGSRARSSSLSRSLCQGVRGLSLLAQRAGCVLGEMLTPLADILKNQCPGTLTRENSPERGLLQNFMVSRPGITADSTMFLLFK